MHFPIRRKKKDSPVVYAAGQDIKAPKRKSRSAQRTRRGKLISAGYLFPSAAGVLLFFVLPFMIVIYYSVVDNPISKQFVFLDNFVSVFR